MREISLTPCERRRGARQPASRFDLRKRRSRREVRRHQCELDARISGERLRGRCNEATSIEVNGESQEAGDEFWTKLCDGGGEACRMLRQPFYTGLIASALGSQLGLR